MFFSDGGNPIDTIEIPGMAGALGLVACPGIRIGEKSTKWKNQRRLKWDLRRLQQWKASGVITLLEEKELKRNGLHDLPDAILKAGMWWKYLPIQDMFTPDDRFERVWERQSAELQHKLANGERVVLHCFAGLGRTGMIAARILVECGMDPARAIATVRAAKPQRIQSKAQFEFVCDLMPPADVTNSFPNDMSPS